MYVWVFQEILDPRTKLLDLIGQVWPLTPTCQIETSNGEGQRKEVYDTTLYMQPWEKERYAFHTHICFRFK
jgi:hypothetical protein